MLTQTRRPVSEEEIAPYRLELSEATSKLENGKRTAHRAVLGYRTACLIFALLFVVGYMIVNVGLLTISLSLFLVTLFFVIGELFSNPEKQWRSLEIKRQNLQALIDRGMYVETHVTAARCFIVHPYDDESPEHYFDLGEQGTLVISEYDMQPGWSPNSDFTLSYFETSNSQRFHEKVRNVGQRLAPVEEISRRGFPEDSPEHFAVLTGSFEEVLQKMRLEGE